MLFRSNLTHTIVYPGGTIIITNGLANTGTIGSDASKASTGTVITVKGNANSGSVTLLNGGTIDVGLAPATNAVWVKNSGGLTNNDQSTQSLPNTTVSNATTAASATVATSSLTASNLYSTIVTAAANVTSLTATFPAATWVRATLLSSNASASASKWYATPNALATNQWTHWHFAGWFQAAGIDNAADSAAALNFFNNNANANLDRKSTRLNSSHVSESRMPSSA